MRPTLLWADLALSVADLDFLAMGRSFSLSLIASSASLVIQGSLASGTLNYFRGHIGLMASRMIFFI